MLWMTTLTWGSELASNERVVMLAATIFFAAGSAFIFTLFVSRVVKSHQQRREKRIKASFQKKLNAIIINETFSTKEVPDSAFEFRMAEIRNILGSSTFAREILIDQILDLKKNLAGAAVHVLTASYFALSLQKQSLKKLRQFAWRNKALGIRELSEMHYQEAIPQISKFIHSSNQTLQEESVMALVRLNTEKSLQFLDYYTGHITPWMQINIHNYLQKSDLRKLPQFHRWFTSKNESVVTFSINMAKQFRQSSAIPHLLSLCTHSRANIAADAIETLGDLEAYEHRGVIVKLSPIYWNNPDITIKILQCLSKIGDFQLDTHIIKEFLNHPEYDVRFEAVKALTKLGLPSAHILKHNSGQGIENILAHTTEPLLQ